MRLLGSGPCRNGRRCGFGFPRISSSLAAEIDFERVPADMSGMSENSDHKNVGIVAVIIGGTVLVLGLIGVAVTLTNS